MATKKVDDVIDEIRLSMDLLRDSMRGIPARPRMFKNMHETLNQRVAAFVAALEEASYWFDEK